MFILHRCCLCGDLSTQFINGEHFCERHAGVTQVLTPEYVMIGPGSFLIDHPPCATRLAGFCPASPDGYCIGGLDGDDGERHCHG